MAVIPSAARDLLYPISMHRSPGTSIFGRPICRKLARKFICFHLCSSVAKSAFVSIADNVARIGERIAAAAARAGRRAEEITLVAVSKTFPAERIREAYAAGIRHFGENRVQEWEPKAAQLADLRDATWHLVGHLQSNKGRRAVELFDAIDSVDSVALAERLDRIVEEKQNTNTEGTEAPFARSERAKGKQRTQGAVGALLTAPRSTRLPILIEVRLAPEESKHGVEPNELPRVVEAVLALPHLELRGLMGIPPWCDEPEDARPYFRRLRELRDEVRQRLGAEQAPQTQRGSPPLRGAQQAAPLPELSMGMSHDFEAAIEEGATQVRVGTAIFGERA